MADQATTAPEPKTYTEEDLNVLRERIRTEERGKLRTRIEEMEAQLAALPKLSQERDTLKQNIAELTTKFESLKASVKQEASGAPVVDIPKLIEEVTAKARERANAETAERLTRLETDLRRSNEEIAKSKLEQYRARRIADEQAKGNKLICELVKGNTAEEIEASITEAQDAFKRYMVPNTPATPPPATPAPATPAPTPGPAPVQEPATQAHAHAQPSPSPTEVSVESIMAQLKSTRDPAKRRALWDQHRDALIDQAEKEVMSGGASVLTR